MYHWLNDKDYLKKLKFTCGGLINELVQLINNEGKMKVEANLVGSGAKGLVTQNANEPVDLDYNLVILDFGDFTALREVKEYERKMFNVVLTRNGWGDCRDSTSVLSTEQRVFKEGNSTPFSIDLAIVCRESNGSWYRLIHEKGINSYHDRYFWNEGPHSSGLEQKVQDLKSNNLWEEVRGCYIDKKNFYLTSNDYNHPSFVCYIEAVNEVYSRYKWTRK